MRTRLEAGFTLVEVLIVSGIIALVAGTAGTFFLAGATPAVASAERDVLAAIDETRRTAMAFDAATLVFAPAASGSGYTARVYARFPGDPGFAARTGPAYDSTAGVTEVAAPLGAPGFALTFDSHGTVTGLAPFTAASSTYTTVACPASGAFALQFRRERETRVVTIPCTLALSAATPVAWQTPAPGTTALPVVGEACPSAESCVLAVFTPPASAPTCPPGSSGTFPNCTFLAQPSPGPGAPSTAPPASAPTAVPTPALTANCIAGPADAAGFASCIANDPLHVLGPSITRQSCGTRTPVSDPGPAFTVEVDVFQNGSVWASYDVAIVELKNFWIDLAAIPPAAICGLTYALAFDIADVTPNGGHAVTSPLVDTGDDPAFDHQGVDAILYAPVGGWGSNT